MPGMYLRAGGSHPRLTRILRGRADGKDIREWNFELERSACTIRSGGNEIGGLFSTIRGLKSGDMKEFRTRY